MIKPILAQNNRGSSRAGWWFLLVAMVVTSAVYSTGLSGGFLFDDYPNIVDNPRVQPHTVSLSSLTGAALSSPSSEFKRPLASLSFAANYLASGLDPYWMKLTNLVIHLLNGLLIFLLARTLLTVDANRKRIPLAGAAPAVVAPASNEVGSANEELSIAAETAPRDIDSLYGAQARHIGTVAALIAAGWMLLPINLTGVLYVVQRMESMANLFVLLGLIAYVAGRRRMLEPTDTACNQPGADLRRGMGWRRVSNRGRAFILCIVSITLPTAVGLLAKETAVMLPLYAFLIEWLLFAFLRPHTVTGVAASGLPRARRLDFRVIALFLLVLALPMALGLTWLLNSTLNPETWATRDFTLVTRLLSEARIVVDYIAWTLLPTPEALSFYHDDFRISSGLLTPWTTLASILVLAALIALVIRLRKRQRLVALGISLFLGCQLLTGTIVPLELIYEHRNYFASFGLLLAIIPLLAARPPLARATAATRTSDQSIGGLGAAPNRVASTDSAPAISTLPLALPRYILLFGLMLCWTSLTALTAFAWGNPLRLAEDLAIRAHRSPRAQYELGRTYIIYSRYDPRSPFTKLAYTPLERAAALPGASIMPEQALIFMNSRMHLPIKEAWWESLIAKLKARKPGVQDESSLGALTQCERERHCDLPDNRMAEAYLAALSHPDPSARLLAMYGDFAWNVLNDRTLGERMASEAVRTDPEEPVYRITLIRMLAATGQKAEVDQQMAQLEQMNYGGRLNKDIAKLKILPIGQ